MTAFVVATTETRRAWYEVDAADRDAAERDYLDGGTEVDSRVVSWAVENIEPRPGPGPGGKETAMSTPPDDQPQVTLRIEDMLITEYQPGQFSLYARGTREGVLRAHEEYLDERGLDARPQSIQRTEIITVIHPVERLET